VLQWRGGLERLADTFSREQGAWDAFSREDVKLEWPKAEGQLLGADPQKSNILHRKFAPHKAIKTRRRRQLNA